MEQRLAFISVLASDLAVNHISIQHAADQLTQLNQEVSYTHVSIPSYSHTPIPGEVGGYPAEVRVQSAAGPGSILQRSLHSYFETRGRGQVPGEPPGRYPGQFSRDTFPLRTYTCRTLFQDTVLYRTEFSVHKSDVECHIITVLTNTARI